MALFVEKYFENELKKNEFYQKKDFPNALIQTFLKIDELLQSEQGK